MKRLFLLLGFSLIITLIVILLAYRNQTTYLAANLPYTTPTQPGDYSTPAFAETGQPHAQQPAPTQSNSNCVHTLNDWLAAPHLWADQALRFDSLLVTSTDITSLLSETNPNLHNQLLQQLVLVTLNQRTGADASQQHATLQQTIAWLVRNPKDTELSTDEQRLAAELLVTLTDFNSGRIYPGYCTTPLPNFYLPSPTSTSPAASTQPSNPPTSTQIPSSTPTRTIVPFIATRTPIPPTQSSGSNPAPPTTAPIVPSATSALPPTPLPTTIPTSAPLPSSTSPALPTQAPTAISP